MAKTKKKKQTYIYKTFDFDFEKETIPVLQTIEKFLREYYGPECKAPAQHCRCCEVYAAYKLFITLLS